jgi:hypothetical protein
MNAMPFASSCRMPHLRRCRAASAEPFGDPVAVERGTPICDWCSRLRGADLIAPIDPKVSAAPWSNRFIFSLMSSRAAHQPLPTRGSWETKMHNSPEYLRKSAATRCAICNGRFGLIRHYSWRTALCSRKCVDRFKARQKSDLRWYDAFRMPAKQLQ